MDVSSRSRARQLARWALAGLVVSTGIILAFFFMSRGERDTSSHRAHRFSNAAFVAPSLDQLLWWNSFSEVEQTKAVLRGLALQHVGRIRTAYLHDRPEYPTTPPSDEPALRTAIRAAERRLEEFRGTEQATLFYGELLRLLRRAERYDAWTDRFLELVYRQPTDPLIDQEAPAATEIACLVGRESEVRNALEHWRLIPSRFRNAPAGQEPDPAGDRAR